MRKYTFIGILILMAGLGAACEDQLNALPGQSKVEGNVILDQKTAEVALNGVYYRFADGGDDRGTPSTMWASSHEISPGLLTGYIRYPYGSVAMEENSSLTANGLAVIKLLMLLTELSNKLQRWMITNLSVTVKMKLLRKLVG